MTRRVVRTDSEVPKKIIIEKKISISLGRIFRTLFQWILCLIRIFWYFFERVFLLAFLIGLTVFLAWWLSQKPSLYRDWERQDALLPTITWSGDLVTIQNIRNHTWQTDTVFTPGYYDATFDLNQIEKMYYIITPFSNKDGPAHTMFSFSFSGGKSVVISPEIRKERGENFDAWKGIMNQYEIQYIAWTETDLIQLRTHYRKNEVYMYPINVPKEKIVGIFHTMLVRANKLSKEPEFYNTFWNNCTTSVLSAANALRKEKISPGIYTILPSHSDEVVYDAWLLDTKLSLPDARAYYRIDELARNAGTGSDFSSVIRKPVQ